MLLWGRDSLLVLQDSREGGLLLGFHTAMVDEFRCSNLLLLLEMLLLWVMMRHELLATCLLEELGRVMHLLANSQMSLALHDLWDRGQGTRRVLVCSIHHRLSNVCSVHCCGVIGADVW